MQTIRWVLLAAVVASGACRAHPVSVVAPEREADVADLTPLSIGGDTSWRTSAAADVQMHTHVVSVAPVAAATVKHSARPVAPRTPAAKSGFAAISRETVNGDPSPDALDDPEGPALLRAQVFLDRLRFSSGVLNGKAGQNMSKAIYFFQEEHSL